MIRIAFAVFMIAHGFAHTVGFAGAWQLSSQIPRKTTLLGDRLDVGPEWIKVVGLIWLMLALAFAVVAAAALLRSPSWPSVAMAVSAASLVMCAVALPDARIGLVINVGLLAALGLGVWLKWLT